MVQPRCGKPTRVEGAPCGRPMDHQDECTPRKLGKRASCAVCGRPFWQGIKGATNELDARCYARRRRGLPDKPIIIDRPSAKDQLTVSLTFNVTPNQMTRMKRAMDRSGLLFSAWLRSIIEAELRVEETREAAGL